MKNLHFTIVLIIILSALTACSSPQVEPSHTPAIPTQMPVPSATPEAEVEASASITPTATATETPTVSPTPTTSPTPEIQYMISAELDYVNLLLSVRQFISIPNNSSTPLNEIMLVVPTNLYQGVFNLTYIAWDDGQEIADHNLRGSQLYIPMQEPLNPGMTKNIILYYELRLPPNNSSAEAGPTPFGYTTRQINLVDWYPFVPPYRKDQGWMMRDPWAYGEFLVYPVANFDVTITLKNLPQAVTIAASAPDTGDGETHKYYLKQGRNFVWSVSPSYTVFEEQLNGTTIMGYVFLPDAVAGEQAFYATVNAFQLYSELYGPYPHPMLTMVEADFDHGMEYQGLYFLNRGFFASYDGTAGSFLIAIAAHETSHQWWYGLVANDQALEPWLDEALATYSEYLFYEYYYPKRLDDFWWDRRVNPYHPAGWVNSTIYNASGYREYRDAVYLQGAIFINDLRNLIGDEAFFAFLKDYASTYANQIATGNDFFRILAGHTDADFTPLLTTYFQR
ncbi:MAG: M1 family metallopeptidase [Anaerolineales bacterium]|nr:M1 family metallopeptidase [Anaerolineales bacterium]